MELLHEDSRWSAQRRGPQASSSTLTSPTALCGQARSANQAYGAAQHKKINRIVVVRDGSDHRCGRPSQRCFFNSENRSFSSGPASRLAMFSSTVACFARCAGDCKTHGGVDRINRSAISGSAISHGKIFFSSSDTSYRLRKDSASKKISGAPSLPPGKRVSKRHLATPSFLRGEEGTRAISSHIQFLANRGRVRPRGYGRGSL